MIHDVVAAVYKGGYLVQLEFDDGKPGVVDFSRYQDKGGVFARFKDMEFFRRFSVNDQLGTLSWGDEVDVAPETLYAEATGSGLPSWMEIDENQVANQREELDPSQAPVR